MFVKLNNLWEFIDDPTPESTTFYRTDTRLFGWGSALSVGAIDSNSNLDLAIGNARAIIGGKTHGGEVRIVVYP